MFSLFGIGGLLGLVIYFAPSIIAWFKQSDNFSTYFLLNLLLGWTVVGWFIALYSAIKE
jgi:hypothetical protein